MGSVYQAGCGRACKEFWQAKKQNPDRAEIPELILRLEGTGGLQCERPGRLKDAVRKYIKKVRKYVSGNAFQKCNSVHCYFLRTLLTLKIFPWVFVVVHIFQCLHHISRQHKGSRKLLGACLCSSKPFFLESRKLKGRSKKGQC